jgi:hypothetical protein
MAAWHHGYGAGVWIKAFNLAVINFNWARGEEDLYTVQFDFRF